VKKMSNNLNASSCDAPEPVADPARRKILLATTVVAGGGVLAATSAAFIASMNPSERAKAAGAPVEADLSRIEPGAQTTFEWRSQPVWILRRTDAMLKILQDPRHLAKLSDPESQVKSQQPAYVRNAFRSVKPEYLVAVGICTHLGCVPTFRPEVGAGDLIPDWDGGYFCPCHGSKFDFAGRVYRNVPAPTNLVIPPYRFLSNAKVLIGENPGAATTG
jgi:ubiquinol-cytochrome c reductase iron-sulfur subunit